MNVKKYLHYIIGICGVVVCAVVFFVSAENMDKIHGITSLVFPISMFGMLFSGYLIKYGKAVDALINVIFFILFSIFATVVSLLLRSQ